jgi:hypothetical protein
MEAVPPNTLIPHTQGHRHSLTTEARLLEALHEDVTEEGGDGKGERQFLAPP